MSTAPVPPPSTPTLTAGGTAAAPPGGVFGWYRGLGRPGRRAFTGAFAGYGLDSYDYQFVSLALTTIVAYFHLSPGQTSLLSTVTLVVSAAGGALAGLLADRIGRARTLLITVGTYAVFTVACGFAPNFETLLVLRALQGFGFGGEWAAGAALVSEYAGRAERGRVLAWVQSSWAVGWGLAALVQALVFALAPDALAWRILFWTGVLPAVLVFWLRRHVEDAPVTARRLARSARRGSFRAILRGRLGRITFFAALLATGVQGGYYTLFSWLPTYLKSGLHLSVQNSDGYLALLIAGSFTGYVTGGLVTDRIGRRGAFVLFGLLSAAFLLVYTRLPAGAATAVLLLGFPLGFCISAIFSGFGSYLAELYPAELRGTGQGFTYNFGRAVGAVFPFVVGTLAGSLGIGGAMGFGALAYLIAALAVFGLPETKGVELR
jgi:MFS family permease